ncbi:response regulator [Halosegnis marinus]|uniref:histidine kinase n=1 Tax=Halosegnis marinus TaxID=3034023 RepID=A0ABD5ZSC3_9EURY|nr:response regulator [Halosegnis sp. DT85]
MTEALRVLHVEDDPDFAELSATYLGRGDDGFEVVTETDPEAALARLGRERVDCVVSDYEMPGTDGLALLREVRERHGDLPFVLFTGKGSEEIASEAISAGVTDYLQKETGTEQFTVLANRVRNAVSKRRAESTLRTRVDQQHALATLGELALTNPPAPELYDRAVGLVAEALDAPFVSLLELDDGGERLVPRANVGWSAVEQPAADDDDGVPATEETMAGYIRSRGEAVFLRDLSDEGRFAGHETLRDVGIVSGAGVPVGRGTKPWGVLLVHTRELRSFSPEDATFLRNIANVLATALDIGEPTDVSARSAPRGLDEVFELSPVGTFVLDADGRVAWANRAVADYFGLERDALVGREQADVVRGSLAPAIEDGEGMAARLLGEEGIEKFECHVLAGEGREERWLQYWSQPVTDGEYAGGRIEHYYDITDRRTLEAELERDLDALGELYEVSASGLPFREKVERLLEYGRNHLGVQVGALNHIHDGRQDTLVAAGDTGGLPRSIPLSDAYCRRTIESTDLVEIENAPAEGYGDDPAYGTTGWACYIGGKVIVDGSPYGTVCFGDSEAKEPTFSDFDRTFVRLLSRWVGYELDRERSQRERARENERLDRFASVVSHDLRNPLSVATGYLDVAREDGSEDAFDRVDAALDRMDEIIDDALATARLGGRVTDPATLSLADLAAEAWATTDAPDATLDVRDDATLSGGEARVKRLLENLFRNSIDHGSADVTVAVGALDDGGFYVADDGPGIPEDERDEVFAGGYTTSEDGTGFGLAIVKAAAEAHGWEVSVTGSESGGARFEFRPGTIGMD